MKQQTTSRLLKTTSVSVSIQEYPDLVSVIRLLAKGRNTTIARLVTDAIVEKYGPELVATRAFLSSFVATIGTNEFTNNKPDGGQ